MGVSATTGPARKELIGEIRDLLALEARLHARVEGELSAGPVRDRPDVRALLRRLEPRVYSHQSTLKQALQRLRGRDPVLRRTLAASLGRVARWMDSTPALPELASGLCDVYGLLSATAAAYLVLASSAQALGDEQTATLAERGADDSNEFLDAIAALLPELARAGAAGEAGTSGDDPGASGPGR
jgi:hypothetical protein